ncbi:MAG: hypothetical protein JRN59_06595 [Nitrososphaerota archaeon]|nr:hypothetical protein [Nitrososphaerota archaeon]
MSTTERDRHSYNEALVRRGELNCDSSVVKEWRREPSKANDGKTRSFLENKGVLTLT